MVQLLCDLGADVHRVANDNTTALFSAARYGHTKIVSLLFSARASLDACLINDAAIVVEYKEPAGYAGISPINAAADGRHLETVRLLAHLGARLLDDRGRSVTEYLHRPRDKQKFENVVRAEGNQGNMDHRRDLLLGEGIYDPRDD